jgi:hypothetical protein
VAAMKLTPYQLVDAHNFRYGDEPVTPEGKVKKEIKRMLDAFDVYYFMPVQMGLGAAGLDFHCVVRFGEHALAFFIEAKKPGDEPTDRQERFAEDRRKQQCARTFVIDGNLDELIEFLERIEEYNERCDDAANPTGNFDI